MVVAQDISIKQHVVVPQNFAFEPCSLCKLPFALFLPIVPIFHLSCYLSLSMRHVLDENGVSEVCGLFFFVFFFRGGGRFRGERYPWVTRVQMIKKRHGQYYVENA